jgi:hypothetical protein
MPMPENMKVFTTMDSGAVDGNVRLVQELISSVPGLDDLYSDHVANNQEVLPYVIFWDITQKTISSFVGKSREPTEWESVLRILEMRFDGGDSEVRSLIITAFLGYLPYPGQPGHGIVDHLGAGMKAQFALMRPRG